MDKSATGVLGPRAQLALDTLNLEPTAGIPCWMIHTMDPEFIEQSSGHAPGDFAKDPAGVYVEFQDRCGTCFIDQFIPDNVLTMGSHGYASDTQRSATTGAEEIVLDGIVIDSPEAVAEHMEKFCIPQGQKSVKEFPAREDQFVRDCIAHERAVQKTLGPNILKAPYDFQCIPSLQYYRYGYANYFMAYALYPELMARNFALQADFAELYNRAVARAILEANLPRMIRLDHDMADSRGTLVDIHSLDRIWFPQLARSIRPLLEADIRLIWHCDGNLMQMVPRLLECGLGGFQGFQYEDGMDYEAICKMKTRGGEGLLIIGGVSVTRTLPFGTPDDVRKELRWLVEKGPKVGLMLGASSSIAPATNRRNIGTFIEGLNYYRDHGRS